MLLSSQKPQNAEHLALFHGIRARLALVFCLLFVIVLSIIQIMGIEGIPFTPYKGQRGQLIQHTLHELALIADAKKERLLYWMNERRSAANFVAANDLVEGDVARLRAAVASARDEDKRVAGWPFLQKEDSFASMDRFFNKIRVAYGFYESIKIADAETGRILVSTIPEETGSSLSTHPAFCGAVKTRGGYLSDMVPAPQGDAPFFYISDLIKNEGRVVAVLILEIDSEKALRPLLTTGDELGSSGETLLVNDHVMPLTKLKYPLADNSEGKPLQSRLKAVPASRASQGDEGTLESMDYRGVQVLAAYRHLAVSPDWGWGMVVKVDSKERFAPIDEQVRYSLLLAFLGCAGTVLCSIMLAGTLTRPLRYITEVAHRIAGGDLSVRSGLKRPDEIGTLSRTLDTMADTIQENLAGLKHRSEELQKITQTLELSRKTQEQALSVSTALASSVSLEETLEKGLYQLMAVTDSQAGAIYLSPPRGDGTLNLALAAGTAPGIGLPAAVRPGESQLDPAKPREPVEILSDIPEDTRFAISTIAGQMLPKSITNISLQLHDTNIGLISLASIYPVSPQQLEVIHMTRTQLAIAISNARVHTETRRLAADLQDKNQELAAMNEELQAQAEELQAQSEELQAQSAELMSKQAQVSEADRLKSEFLSNMSHELRTPLNSIMALSQLMIARGPQRNPEQDLEFLEVIDRNGRHLLNLINEILDLSKIEAGRVDVRFSHFAPDEVVDEALETIRPLAEKKRLKILVQPCRVQTLCSDRDTVRQILINLLSNAVKFTPEGEIEIRVKKSAGWGVSFAIRDTGLGIAPEAIGYIFDEFRQVDGSTTRSHEGTGLGLTICKKLAHILNGEITVESEPGKGSTFTLTLPVEPPDFPQADQAEPRQAAGSNAASPSPSPLPCSIPVRLQHERTPLILVAEDNPIAVLQLRSALEEEGYRVEAATGGEQVLPAIERQMPDGILLDLMMPGVDGFKVLEQLRAKPATRELPVLVLTAKELSGEERRLLASLGVVQALQKGSLNRKKLIAQVHQLTKQPVLQAPPSPSGSRDVADNHPQSGKLLIVEDNPDNRFTLEALLSDMGVAFDSAENGLQAVEMARERRPGLILMDIHLPQLNGLDATRRLKSDAQTARIPIVALTARAMKGDKESILAAGCDGYLSKPIDPGELAEAISNWLQAPSHA